MWESDTTTIMDKDLEIISQKKKIAVITNALLLLISIFKL